MKFHRPPGNEKYTDEIRLFDENGSRRRSAADVEGDTAISFTDEAKYATRL